MNDMVFAQGLCFYKVFCVFVIGAILGDIAETVFCYGKYKKWLSRSSFVYGHMSIVWGFAFVIATILFYRMEQVHPFAIFIVGTVLGGAYEYLCSLLAETCLGVKFWDYSKFSYNLSGRINLKYCFLWGLATLIWMKFIFPILEGGIEKIPVTAGTVLCNILIIVLCVDALLSVVAIKRYMIRNSEDYVEHERWNRFDRLFSNERMEQIYPHMKLCEKETAFNQGYLMKKGMAKIKTR